MSIEILVTAGIATAALLVSTWQAWMLRRSEQLRTQPIVIVGEQSEPERGVGDGPATVGLFVRNGGAGSAFGVMCRFENAFGQQWETRNSSAEDKPLEIGASWWRGALARGRRQAAGER